MASSVSQADIKREKFYLLLIFLAFLLAFLVVFQPIRLAPKNAFHTATFTFRYPQTIGPGQRPKEQIRTAFTQEWQASNKELALDTRMTFPTTHEIKVSIPLESRDEAGRVQPKLMETLAKVVPAEFGKPAPEEPNTDDFGDPALRRVGPFALYHPTLKLRRGLDLQGGVHLVLQARTQNVQYEYKLAPTAAELTRALDAYEAKAGAAATGATPAEDGKAAPAEATKAAETKAEAPKAEAPKAAGAKAAAPAETKAEAPKAADTKAEAPKAADGKAAPATQPDGGEPVRMAQADDAKGEAPAGDEDAEPLQETEVSGDEARLLADEDLRLRVADVIAAITNDVRARYAERLGDITSDAVGSNIVVFSTYVRPRDVDAEDKRRQQQQLLLSELKAVFPQVVALGEPQQLDIPANAVEQVKDVIGRRVDRLGVSEAAVRTQGQDRVVVELPGLRDPEEAVRILGTTARLEFRKVPSGYVPQIEEEGGREVTRFSLKDSPSQTVPTEVVYYEAPEFEGNKNIIVGSNLAPGSVHVQLSQTSEPAVSLSLSARGARRFDAFAEENVGEYLGIYLDREVISAPVMRASHFGGQVQISGGFKSIDEANELQVLLAAGALPVPVDIVEQRMISATLGADQVAQSLRAGLAGLLLILILMVALFRSAGLFSVLSLCLYCLITLAVLVTLNATLTLPGILGLILSIGMAVDANVIVFERLREELRDNPTRPVTSSIRNAYDHAKTAIYDGNLTTLLMGVVLYWLGTGPLRGFAVTLSIGILCSVITAMWVTPRFQYLFAATRPGQDRRMYRH